MQTKEPLVIGERKKTFRLHEDWLVVALGYLTILSALYISLPPTPAYGWKNHDDLFHKVLTVQNIGIVGIQFVVSFLVGSVIIFTSGKSLIRFLPTFLLLFFISVSAQIFAGSALAKSYNLEAVIFSLTLGLLIGNIFTLPAWMRELLSAELYVKIGLVLLGTSVIFGDILKAGSLGLVQALIVVVAVWYFAYWLCRRLKLDEELTVMLASAVSICGVSAAIATAGAIKGDSKKLSYVISLVLITAIPMMLSMPWLAKEFGLSEEVTGAWLGGSIDTTGAVVASGSLVGETALKVSTIVKFSQNVLLGLAAFAISIYWTYSDRNQKSENKPSLKIIWERFPKFVIGFIGASLLFSFILPSAQVNTVKDGLKSLQTLWFVLAFTSIGLETRFKDLTAQQGVKPMAAFLIAQLFNILITLGIALLLFDK